MRRSAVAVVLAGIAMMTAAPVAGAQVQIFVGGAASVPLSDTKDVLKTGWLGNAGLVIPIKPIKHFAIGAEGYYGSSKTKVGDVKVTLSSVFGNVGYELMSSKMMSLYVFGGGGSMSSKPKGGISHSDGAYQVGGGLSHNLMGGFSLFGDVRYMSGGSGTSKTTLLPITIGIGKALGKM